MAYRDYEDGSGYVPDGPGNPAPPDDFAQQLTALYAKYGHPPPTPEEVQAHRGNPQGINGVENMLIAEKGSSTPKVDNPPVVKPPPPPPPGPTLGGVLTQPYSGTFTPPTPAPMPGVPTYTPPGYEKPPAFSFRDFTPPDAQTVLNRPGYDFRRKQGEQSILNDRAHSGLLNTGSTLKDIIGYGQDFATGEFNNEWNRSANEYMMDRGNAVDTYNTNYRTQFQDPYQISRQSALDAFAPKMVGYTTDSQATQRSNELDWSHAYDLSNFDWNKYKDLRDFTWRSNYDYATA